MRTFKFVIGITLFPACWALLSVFSKTLRASIHADEFWIPFAAGAICWITLDRLLPKQTRLYVLAHESTHAIWCWLFMGRVRSFRIRPTSGEIIVSRNNFLISLAPYFFPLYAITGLVLFAAAQFVSMLFSPDMDIASVLPFLHLFLGAACAFHVTFTTRALMTNQSDVLLHGRVFSAVVILLGNLAFLGSGIACFTLDSGLKPFFNLLCSELTTAYSFAFRFWS